MSKRDARTLSPAAQEELRRRGVKMVIKDKLSQTEVAHLLEVSPQTVSGWIKTWRSGGTAALRSRRRGRRPGAGAALAPWQQAQIAQAVKNNTPDRLGLECLLWTRRAVADLVEARFGIRLALTTVGAYLRTWKFTPQKPLRRAVEQDPAAVARWLNVRYPAIAAQARKDKALIFWADQLGVRSDHQAGRSWAKRGQTPVIRGTGRRFSVNVMSALTNRGHLEFMCFDGSFNAAVCIDFLDRLTRAAGRKAHVIVDGHPVHRSAKVTDWVAAHPQRIAWHLLPSYSPQLNPDELLNNDVKTNAVGRRRPRTKQQMSAEVEDMLQHRKQQPNIIRRYFHEPHVRYAA